MSDYSDEIEKIVHDFFLNIYIDNLNYYQSCPDYKYAQYTTKYNSNLSPQLNQISDFSYLNESTIKIEIASAKTTKLAIPESITKLIITNDGLCSTHIDQIPSHIQSIRIDASDCWFYSRNKKYIFDSNVLSISIDMHLLSIISRQIFFPKYLSKLRLRGCMSFKNARKINSTIDNLIVDIGESNCLPDISTIIDYVNVNTLTLVYNSPINLNHYCGHNLINLITTSKNVSTRIQFMTLSDANFLRNKIIECKLANIICPHYLFKLV